MSDQISNEQDRVEKIAKDTKQVEAKYQKQQALKRQKKLEKEDLSQRWVAPLVLAATLLIGFIITKIFQ